MSNPEVLESITDSPSEIRESSDSYSENSKEKEPPPSIKSAHDSALAREEKYDVNSSTRRLLRVCENQLKNSKECIPFADGIGRKVKAIIKEESKAARGL